MLFLDNLANFSAEANDFGARTLLIFVKFGKISKSSKTLEGTLITRYVKMLSIHTDMISIKFIWENLLLREEINIDKHKNLYFDNFQSTLYEISEYTFKNYKEGNFRQIWCRFSCNTSCEFLMKKYYAIIEIFLIYWFVI